MLGDIARRVEALKQDRAAVCAELDAVISQARRMQDELGPSSAAHRSGTRRFSPEARQRIADAARRRWAAYHATKGR